ncbi:hypothetical protein MTR_6g035365 [Medicago truncatula]|uniref:Transmembrane protein n=1 Tax=Medicago truncatula TaxID=3880 RepID=A0A072UJA1_MEDTR|nr:hypothetical protein MTR_6g035365 [Medicago truncatula]
MSLEQWLAIPFFIILLMIFKIKIRHGSKSHNRGYPPEPNLSRQVFAVLTGFGYEFAFSPISRHRYGTGKGDGDEAGIPEPAEEEDVVKFLIPVGYVYGNR